MLKNITLILLVIILIVWPINAAEICPPDQRIIEIESRSRGVHILVENCENIGTFSLGGLYGGGFEKLTFSYPIPWRGTFISLKVGDKVYSNSMNPETIDVGEGNFLDSFVTELPHVDGEEISMKWLLPENVAVEQILEAIDGGTKITIKATNLGDEVEYLGARIHLDTMLGENDGAPIYIPGDGLKSYESEYYGSKLNCRYWKAYNKADNPSIIATGILEGEGLTYPDGVVIANWKSSMRSAWDYEIDPFVSILGDSALILYYSSQPVEPGETLTFTSTYVNGEPVLPVSKGNFGIAEIVTDRVNARYCPQDNISVKVDILSRKTEHEGRITFKVMDSSGKILYEEDTDSFIVGPDSVESVEFRFKVSDQVSRETLKVVSALYAGESKIDEKNSELVVDREFCDVAPPGEGIDWMSLFLTLIVFLLLMAVIYSVYSYLINRGEVEVTKDVDGELIKVNVSNNTRRELRDCVLKDRIIDGAEVNVKTAGVHRRGNELTWNIGKISPGEDVVLEYKMKKAGLLPPAVFKWDSGEKETE